MTTTTMTGSPLAVVTQEPIVAGTLFGPVPIYPGVLDPLVWLAWRCHDNRPQPDQIIKVDPRDLSASGASSGGLSWLSHIQPARDSEEQNLEVIVMAGQLFYRALREINIGEEMMAWFGKDLKEALRLPSVPSTTVDGEVRYYCTLCSEVFRFCNPMVAHLMYRCSKRGYPSMCKAGTQMADPIQGGSKESSAAPTSKPRVQGFDIASLAESSTQYSTEPRLTDEDAKPEKQRPSPGLGNHRTISEDRPKCYNNKRLSSSDDPPTPSHSAKKSKASANRERAAEAANGQHYTEDPSSRLPTTSTSDPVFHSMRTNGNRNGLLSPQDEAVKIESHQDSLSAFKKVDKMSSPPSVPVLSQVSPASHSYSIPISTMSPAEMLYRSAMNPLHPFPYPLPSVASSPPGGATLPPSLVSAVPHSLLSSASELSSAFGPTIGYTNGDSMAKIQQEMKLQRPADMLDNRSMYSHAHSAANGPRLSNFGFPYAKSFPTPLDNFASKSVPTSLLSFLPPSLAALTFPTQNWCAKCNATFRMTSDLVYHMRSHHKRDIDPSKKKREEKLRCNICNETFRERHHLTRHMTSHQ